MKNSDMNEGLIIIRSVEVISDHIDLLRELHVFSIKAETFWTLLDKQNIEEKEFRNLVDNLDTDLKVLKTAFHIGSDFKIFSNLYYVLNTTCKINKSIPHEFDWIVKETNICDDIDKVIRVIEKNARSTKAWLEKINYEVSE